MKPQKADEVTAAPGDKSFEKLTKCLLGVRKAEFDKLRNADQEHNKVPWVRRIVDWH